MTSPGAQESGLHKPDVSRETHERLKIFENLLRKWSGRINLVSRASLDDFSRRHLDDSRQIFDAAPIGASHWADLGSGGGLPGLIVAILAAERSPEMKVTLVESDQRKAAFLMTAAREVGIKIAVIAERIEETTALHADVISARALAPLIRLLEYAERHLHASGICLFQKGISYREEFEEAQRVWDFTYEAIPSRTQAGAVILRIPMPINRQSWG